MKILGFTFGRTKRLEGEYLAKAAVEPGRIDNWGAPLVPSTIGWGRQGVIGGVFEAFAGAWQRNIVCERESILAFGAVYACVTRIANDIAKLPINLVELTGDGIWTAVGTASPYWAVLRKPNHWQNRIQFITQWLLSKLITGNTYVLKERDARGIVTALYVLDPSRVSVLVASDGGVYYRLAKDDLSQIGDQITVPGTEMIHDRMNPLFHPLVGVSPLYAAASSATQGIQIQRNSIKFFSNMSKPGGILTAPAKISDDNAKRIKEYWEAGFTGENAGRVAVLGDGMKYEQLAVPAVEAQLAEQLKLTKEDIAGIFAMPLYKIGAGPVPANNNVEALNQQYHSDCLQTHLESIELCLDEGLGLDKVPGKVYGCEFDLDVLLRMDSATQIKTLAEGVGAAIYSPNEARRRMNLPPVDGGETPYLQQQNYSLAALDKRDSQDDPFAKEPPPALAESAGEQENPEVVEAAFVGFVKSLELELA